MITITITIKREDDGVLEVNYHGNGDGPEKQCHSEEKKIAKLYRDAHDAIFEFLAASTGIGTKAANEKGDLPEAVREAVKIAHDKKMSIKRHGR